MDKNSRPSDMAEEVAAAVPKEFQEAFTRVVKAGMKVMFSEDTHEIMLDALEGEGPLPEKIGSAMADLMGMLFEKSNQSMPPEVIIPAATYLLAKGSDFLEKVTEQEISGEDMALASEIMVQKLMTAFGIPEDALAKAGEAASQVAREEGEMAPAEEEMPPAEEGM